MDGVCKRGGGTGGEEAAALKERVWTTEIPPTDKIMASCLHTCRFHVLSVRVVTI